METAHLIASKSPIAIQGTKEMLLYARDHSVEEGLNHVATWNSKDSIHQPRLTSLFPPHHPSGIRQLSHQTIPDDAAPDFDD
jgi:hypothetical protein